MPPDAWSACLCELRKLAGQTAEATCAALSTLDLDLLAALRLLGGIEQCNSVENKTNNKNGWVRIGQRARCNFSIRWQARTLKRCPKCNVQHMPLRSKLRASLRALRGHSPGRKQAFLADRQLCHARHSLDEREQSKAEGPRRNRTRHVRGLVSRLPGSVEF